MIKNKKSVTLVPESLVRMLVAIAIVVLIIVPAWSRIEAVFFNSEEVLTKSLENFVNNINNMPLGRDKFTVKLLDKTALIGFSKDSERFECFNCQIGIAGRPTIIVEKPPKEECNNKACVCTCTRNFNLAESTLDNKPIKIGKCPMITCKTIENRDIVSKTTVKYFPGSGGEEYWKDGFLFTNNVLGSNGLRNEKNEINPLIVERRYGIIGVCNEFLMQRHKEQMNFDQCIITEYDVAKRLESEDVKASIEKYQEFIEKYEEGPEVEESLFRIGLQYQFTGQNQKAIDTFNIIVTDFPASVYREDADKRIQELENI